MVKATKTKAEKFEAGAYPVPFSLESFRKDIANVYLHYARSVGFMKDRNAAWTIVGMPEAADAFPPGFDPIIDPGYDAEEVGLKYELIRHTWFAATLEQLYAFAFFGRISGDAQLMNNESVHMWITALVHDAHHGYLAQEFDASGFDVRESTANCMFVAELANARNMLEGGEPFFYFRGTSKDDETDFDCLNIRQMALLAGMEEMSIRSAANPKRANHLQTMATKDGTRITFEVAKAWLESKGRYIPIVRVWLGEIDLAKRGFADPRDLNRALNARYRMIGERDGLLQLDSKLQASGIATENAEHEPYLFISDTQMGDEALMRAVAEHLQLPTGLLALRCKEVLMRGQLAAIEQELRAATEVSSTDQKSDQTTNE